MPPFPIDHKRSGHRNQTHPQVDEDYYTGKDLGYRVYYGKDLARIIWQQYDIPIASRLSTTQKALLRSRIPRCKTTAELQTLLNQWMALFDAAFFFKSVQKRWSTVTFECPPDRYGQYDSYGLGIQVNDGKPPPHNYRGTPETWYICVLVHEMLHAFLETYTCKSASDGCKDKWAPWMGGEGETGHGPAWANSMLAITEALQKEVSWQVNTAIGNSVRFTMKHTGWQPRQDQLRRWKMI